MKNDSLCNITKLNLCINNIIYRPYLPAITIYIGALAAIVGLILTHYNPMHCLSSVLLIIGPFIAALGSLWSAHRQILSSHENKALNQKIISLQSQIINQLTGGDSFCYGRPIFNLGKRDLFNWGFIHNDEFAIKEVSVRIHNCSKENNLQFQSYALGTIFPGRIHQTSITDLNKPTGSYNLFFLASNGSWTQEIRWTHFKDELAIAVRVIRDGDESGLPIYFEVSKNNPDIMDIGKPWQ